MKMTISRKVAIAFGGILAATLVTGCFGGDPGYSNGYNSSYSSYGSSYPYSGYSYNRGYSYPRSSGNSYNAGYQNGLRADRNRDYNQHTVVARERGEERTEAQH